MKILIIDDDRVMRILLRRILQRVPSYELIEAVDGLAAWYMLQEGLAPDLCLLDIMMPRMDGIEFLEKIRCVQRYKSLRVMVCSAVNDRARITHASSLDILAYIIKPFVATKVLEQVQKVLSPREEPKIIPAAKEDPRNPGNLPLSLEMAQTRLEALAQTADQIPSISASFTEEPLLASTRDTTTLVKSFPPTAAE